MITITGYNEDWPKRFAEIRDCLRSELAGEVGDFEVEHFGSTAVLGLVARPLLDLCVVVPDDASFARPPGWTRPAGLHLRTGSRRAGPGDLPPKGAGCAVSRAQEGLLAASSLRFGLGFS